jgi:hypothetical protein
MLLISSFIFQPFNSFAGVGVGVDTGKIVVDEQLLPGITYTLPSINVLNTGDEKSFYQVNIEINDREGKLNPGNNWFTLSPKEFELEPDAQQKIEIKLTIPTNGVQPGEYSAFLTAKPFNEGDTIGAAAATKVYFTVKGTNIIQTTYYTLRDIFADNQPWSTLITFAPPLILVLYILRKKLRITYQTREKNS